MYEPVPIGRKRWHGHWWEVRQGRRGKRGIPEHDRVLLFDGQAIGFETYFARRSGLAPRVRAKFELFFEQNENAVFPPPRWEGAEMFRKGLRILDDQGLDAALEYIAQTKRR